MKKNQYNKYGGKEGYWEIEWCNKLHSKGNFVNGKRDGHWLLFNRNGRLWNKGNFVNGISHGYWECFDNNGVLYKIEYFYI
jgi:antitoxin component YwqK of YwqJK toxin-antitoxin module